ncbi:MAG: hypothetical protein ABIH41_02790, partial [Nanoarchaeota archaeon]
SDIDILIGGNTYGDSAKTDSQGMFDILVGATEPYDATCGAAAEAQISLNNVNVGSFAFLPCYSANLDFDTINTNTLNVGKTVTASRLVSTGGDSGLVEIGEHDFCALSFVKFNGIDTSGNDRASCQLWPRNSGDLTQPLVTLAGVRPAWYLRAHAEGKTDHVDCRSMCINFTAG